MVIDTTKPVRLLRHVAHQGNFYHPREYQPGELPQELLIEGTVVQGETAIAYGAAKPFASFSPIGGAFEPTEIKIDVQRPAATPTTFTQVQPPLVVTRVQVNQATVEVLSNLAGVTVPVAKKIVEERQKALFKDTADLDARASLGKGIKWEILQEQILFD